MKKLLLSASKIALTFSLILHTAHAMEKEGLDIGMDVETAKTTSKRKADALENNSGTDFETPNQNNMREANTTEGNSVTKKVKPEDTRITFPLEKFFPILEKCHFPNELTVKIVQALGSGNRKVYSLVNHQCKNFIDFCTTSISLKIDLKKFKFDAYYEFEGGNTAPMANFDFLLMFPNLESLEISHDLFVEPTCFQSLRRLKRLDLEMNSFIRSDAISVLTNLEELNLAGNIAITNSGITSLTKLKLLNLQGNLFITNDAISMLTNLEELNLDLNNTITNDGIRLLTKLKTLNLSENLQISDGTLALFTNLTDLNLGYNQQITDAGLKTLTNIEILDIIAAPHITRSSIENQKKLRSLSFDLAKFNIVSLITTLPSLNILDFEMNRMEGQQATQNLIDLIDHLFAVAEKNRDKIDETDFLALKKWYAVELLPHILNPQDDEEYTSTYPLNTISFSREDVNKIIETRKRIMDYFIAEIPLNTISFSMEDVDEIIETRGRRMNYSIAEMLMDDIKFINRLFKINNLDTRLIFGGIVS